MTPAVLVVDALATARLTRLVTRDRLTLPARRRAIRKAYSVVGAVPPGELHPEDWPVIDPNVPPLAYLLTCQWCASVWVGGAVVLARAVAPNLWDPVARALAASQVAGMAASTLD